MKFILEKDKDAHAHQQEEPRATLALQEKQSLRKENLVPQSSKFCLK